LISSKALQLQIRRRLKIILGFGLIYLLISFCPLMSRQERAGIAQLVLVCAGLLNLRWLTQGLLDPELRQRTSPRQRLSINLLTAAFVFSVSSALLAGMGAQILKQALTFPSIADAAMMLAYLIGIVGLLLFPSARLSAAAGLRILLDALMTSIAGLTFGWCFLIAPQLVMTRTPLQTCVGIGYPLMDAVLFFCVLVLAARPGNKAVREARSYLTVGFSCSTIGDVFYVYDNLHHTYLPGQPSDIFSLFGLLFIGLSAYVMRRTSEEQEESAADTERHRETWQAYLPYAVLPATLGLLLYVMQHSANKTLTYGVMTGCVLLIGLMLIRQLMAISENRRLNGKLQQAHVEMEQYARRLETVNEELQAMQEELTASNHELAESNARLEALATTDGMTGLPNHRHFQECLHAAPSLRQPTALLLLDVDKFKQYNDSFGHPAGDEALRIVAQILTKNTRSGDLPARYGGEEFAVILHNTSELTAIAVAERIRAAVEAYPFPHRATTVSIGVCVSPDGSQSPEQMLAAADAALYQSKNNGRNRVTVAPAELSRAA
jgi:diguanylate cyclase (GGDEF)-like protein